MGADLWRGGDYNTERRYWVGNKKLPEGTALYREARENKNNFITKYYGYDDNGNDVIELPKEKMWVIKCNGKRAIYQDDDNLYIYILDRNGAFVKYKPISCMLSSLNKYIYFPIRHCDSNEWCQLYPDSKNQIRYVKKLILSYHL